MKRFEKKDNVFDGKGSVWFEYLVGDSELNGMCRLYAKVTIPKGSSLGYHVHMGDREVYYIMSGTGKYVSGKDGKLAESIVGAGDVTFTPEGEGHGIENTGEEDLVLMALVIYEEQKTV